MLNFPESTKLNKRIPKQKFYENLNITAKEKRLFIDEVDSIYWAYKISADTLAIGKSEDVEEVEIIEIKLNQKSVSETVLKMINKAIPYQLVFSLEYQNECRFAVFYHKFYYSEWQSVDVSTLVLEGITTGTVWENFVRQVLEIKTTGKTFESQIVNYERIMQLKQQIAALEKKRNAEKQFNRQVEMNNQIKNLKSELKEIENG